MKQGKYKRYTSWNTVQRHKKHRMLHWTQTQDIGKVHVIQR